MQAVKALNEASGVLRRRQGRRQEQPAGATGRDLPPVHPRPGRLSRRRNPRSPARSHRRCLRERGRRLARGPRRAASSRPSPTELPEDGVGAFLVWGDPALYDSTLRRRSSASWRAGSSPSTTRSFPASPACRRSPRSTGRPLNRTGEPVHITTGRRLAAGFPDDLDSVLVMLDAGLACQHFDDPELDIHWGAYLGTPDEVLMSGRLDRRRGRHRAYQAGAQGAARLDHGYLPAATYPR